MGGKESAAAGRSSGCCTVPPRNGCAAGSPGPPAGRSAWPGRAVGSGSGRLARAGLRQLVVKEPDSPPGSGGWALADLKRFWLARGAWGAVNVDGGPATQMTYLRTDGRYELVPSRWGVAGQRLTLAPDFRGAPEGGT